MLGLHERQMTPSSSLTFDRAGRVVVAGSGDVQLMIGIHWLGRCPLLRSTDERCCPQMPTDAHRCPPVPTDVHWSARAGQQCRWTEPGALQYPSDTDMRLMAASTAWYESVNHWRAPGKLRQSPKSPRVP